MQEAEAADPAIIDKRAAVKSTVDLVVPQQRKTRSRAPLRRESGATVRDSAPTHPRPHRGYKMVEVMKAKWKMKFFS